MSLGKALGCSATLSTSSANPRVPQKDGRCSAGLQVPIPRLDRNQLAIVEADSEDLAFDDGEVEQIALGKLAERNMADARIHVVHIISKASPDSAERLRA